jgi:hypothetical protein
MAKYGIPYQGSKSNISDSIITFLPKGKRFVDLFGGGFAMTDCAMRSGKYESFLYNELNPLLPELIKKAINGDYNYDKFKPAFVGREEFDAKRKTDGYIAYIWSFGNNPEKRYMFAKDLEPKKKSLHNFVVFGIKDDFIKTHFDDIDKYVKGDDIYKRRILLGRYMKMKQAKRPFRELQQLERLERLQQLQQLERLQQLQQLEIACGSYLDYKYQEGDIVYCDPPYEGTAEYAGGFDSKQFYDWVMSRPYQVWFSSYQISDKRPRMVWAKGKSNLMAGASGQKQNYECIYTNR